MPRVPIYQDKQRMNPQNPTGFQSAERAGIIGEGIASVGRGLAHLGDVKDKMAKTEKKLAVAEAVEDAKTSLMEIKGRLAKDKSNGDKDTEIYDDESVKAIDKVRESIFQKYGETYSAEIELALKTVRNGFREDVIATSVKKTEDFLIRTDTQLKQQHASRAYYNPETLNDVMWEAIDQNTEILKIHEKSEDYITAANKSLAASLALGAIDGSADQGNFKQARKILRDNHVNFTSDQLEKVTKEVNQKEMDFTRRQNEMEALLEKRRKEEEDKKVNTYMNSLRAKMIEAEQNGDVASMSKYMNEFIKFSNEKYPASKAFGGNLNEINKYRNETLKQKDNATSFKIAQKFIDANSTQDLDNLQKEVILQERFQNISNKKAQEWLLRLEGKNKSLLSDPKAKAVYLSYKGYLNIYTKSKEAVEMGKDPAALQKYYGTHMMYDLLVANGTPPEIAFMRSVQTYFPLGSDDEVGRVIPGYSELITNEEQLKSAKKFIDKMTMMGNPGAPEAYKHYQLIEQEFKFRKEMEPQIKQMFNKSQQDIKEVDKQIEEANINSQINDLIKPDAILPFEQEFDRAFRIPERK